MPTPLLYVIIPVFNQERYVESCLESVISQERFEECEVIVMNDGSTDGSLQICETLAARHPNIRVITTANAGLGAARNRGLREIPETAGGYVTFLDSDDYWDPGYLESFLRVMSGEPDAIAGHIEGIETTPAWEWLSLFHGPTQRYADIRDVPLLLRDVSCCDKAFRLELVRRLGLSFAENRHFEDLWFAPHALACASGIVINTASVYRYRMGETESIMSNAFARPKNYWDHLAGAEHLMSLREQVPESKRPLLEDLALYTNQWFIHRASQNLDAPDFDRYFAESARIFAGVSQAAVERATTSWASRRAYVALLDGDIERMRLAAPSLDEMTLRDGRLHYGDELPRSSAEGAGDAFKRVFDVRAWLGFLDITDEGVTFSGHIQVPGAAIQVPATQMKPALRVGDEEFVGEWHRRGDSLASADATQEWSGFSVPLPRRGAHLKHGRQSVSFVLIGAGDSGVEPKISCQLQANGGYLREARLVELADCNLVPVTDDKNWVVFLVGPRHRFFNVPLWRAARARSAVQAHQPFAKMKVLATMLSFVPGKPVWLLAERENTAQDNSAALFRYLRQECPNIDAYYVIDADAKQRDRVAEVGHVVDRGSWKHVVLFLRARVLVSAFDIDRYMLPPRWNAELYRRHLAWFLGTPRVFLNHGVSYTDVSQSLSRRYTGISTFFASSLVEGEYTKDRMDYTDQVVTSGLPRFDLLERRPAQPRRLLFMPTWRTYLQVGEPGSQEYREFLQSAYWHFLASVLDDPRLTQVLERHDLILEIYPHYEVAPLISAAAPDSDRIRVVDQAERSVREAIAEASLFITDWTSVFFDAAYAGLPVIHAPFDREEFLSRHYRPGFFDFDSDGFGPVVVTPEALVTAVESYAERDFQRETEFDERAERFFTQRGGHSAAAVEAITTMLERRR